MRSKKDGGDSRETDIVRTSADYLSKVDFIDFAVLFGSFAEDKDNSLSDIDIGIFVNRDISLLERGMLATSLESKLEREIDIAVLNGLYKKNPLLAYDIISKGRIITCKDQEKITEFKKNTLLYFMDTRPLRDMVDGAFRKRLDSGRFGESNYA